MKPAILITGAGQRIGFYLASQLQAQGYPVVITYRREKPTVAALRELGVRCIQANFESDQDVAQFCQQLTLHCPALRAIIHNASEWHTEQDSDDLPALFDRMMFIHGKVPYLLNHWLADTLVDGSDIIHISDYVVERGSSAHIAYAASKAALENMARSFAAKLAPKVKVNAIAPSLIIFNPDDSAAYREKTLKKSLMGTEPGEQEIFNAVRCLLDSQYITGRTLHVDGGRHLKAGT